MRELIWEECPTALDTTWEWRSEAQYENGVRVTPRWTIYRSGDGSYVVSADAAELSMAPCHTLERAKALAQRMQAVFDTPLEVLDSLTSPRRHVTQNIEAE
jgi:hypothetical protein